MSNLEHYFENLLFHGQDINGDLNKNQLTPEQIKAVEICASYVKYTMFNSDEELQSFLNEDSYEPVRHGHWEQGYISNEDGSISQIDFDCSVCGQANDIKSNYCPNCGAKMDEKE